MAKDMLFATLDPTLRRLTLPNGTEIILSDTVGFVSDLPTHLVAAFRATLEEVIEAELILHVRDVSDPDHAVHSEDVYSILSQLGVEDDGHARVVEVWNKVDRLSADTLEAMRTTREGEDGPLFISATTGAGLDTLVERIETVISRSDTVLTVSLANERLGQIGWFYDHSQVLEREDAEDGSVNLTIRVPLRRQAEALSRAETPPINPSRLAGMIDTRLPDCRSSIPARSSSSNSICIAPAGMPVWAMRSSISVGVWPIAEMRRSRSDWVGSSIAGCA